MNDKKICANCGQVDVSVATVVTIDQMIPDSPADYPRRSVRFLVCDRCTKKMDGLDEKIETAIRMTCRQAGDQNGKR